MGTPNSKDDLFVSPDSGGMSPRVYRYSQAAVFQLYTAFTTAHRLPSSNSTNVNATTGRLDLLQHPLAAYTDPSKRN
jgi:hypothetical protein